MNYLYQNGLFVNDKDSNDIKSNTTQMNIGDTFEAYDENNNLVEYVITNKTDLGFTIIVSSEVVTSA